mmetsp:Transcript_8344/g.17689  ORF Transcript_8344/g.17689 Transcript_8344/m.17689 type:complete len:227 (-) Transcript_8344:1044-1724(-)
MQCAHPQRVHQRVEAHHDEEGRDHGRVPRPRQGDTHHGPIDHRPEVPFYPRGTRTSSPDGPARRSGHRGRRHPRVEHPRESTVQLRGAAAVRRVPAQRVDDHDPHQGPHCSQADRAPRQAPQQGQGDHDSTCSLLAQHPSWPSWLEAQGRRHVPSVRRCRCRQPRGDLRGDTDARQQQGEQRSQRPSFVGSRLTRGLEHGGQQGPPSGHGARCSREGHEPEEVPGR